MCHHHPSREWADLREAIEAEAATDEEAEAVDAEPDDEARLPPIQPSD